MHHNVSKYKMLRRFIIIRYFSTIATALTVIVVAAVLTMVAAIYVGGDGATDGIYCALHIHASIISSAT
jgi:hypothetical protein